MHEHPLQRFFKSLREQPIFAWERFQMRDVLVIDHPLCQAFSLGWRPYHGQHTGPSHGRLHTHKARRLVKAHPQQWPAARMPDHRVGTVASVDAQFALPGVVLELQLSLMLEHALAAAIDAQLTLLLANLTTQLVVTLRPVEPRQRYLAHVANPPIGVQSVAQLARQLILMLGAQAQFEGFAQVRMQVHLPIAQLQLPMQAHTVVIGAAVQ